jgi:hypothetical protein
MQCGKNGGGVSRNVSGNDQLSQMITLVERQERDGSDAAART